MKKVLLPTDFSEAAKNATRYAIELFGKDLFPGSVEFTLYYVHFYVPTGSTGMGTPDFQAPELLDARRADLEAEAKLLKDNYPEIELHYEMVVGNVASSVVNKVQDTGYDFVVVGSHPKSGLDRWIEGLNAHTIATETKCPVLVIPQDTKFKPLEKVILATDFKDLGSFEVLNPLREIVQTSGSQFLMLHIYPENESFSAEKETLNENLEDYFGADKYQFFFLEDDDPKDSIEEFALSYQSDLLTLTSQDRSFFESLFHESVTKNLIIHSKIPLLVLNKKESRAAKEDDEPLKERLQRQLKNWKSELDGLQLQMHLGKKELQDQWEERRNQAKHKVADIQKQLDNLEDLSEDRWDHFRKELSEAMDHVKSAFKGKA